MSYVRSLGDILSPIQIPGAPSDVQACVDKANASPQVASIDALINNLAAKWNPTGYFLPDDVQAILDTLADQAASAGAALSAAPSSTSDALEAKAQAFDTMLGKYQDRSKTYAQAVADARSSGANVINAPALKDFVISSMLAISSAYVTAAVLQCSQSWLESILDAGYNGMAIVGSVAANVLGVVYKVGQTVVKVVDTAVDLAAFVAKYAPVAAVGLGAYVIYKLLKKKKT